ncbi:uncharacterized protein BDW70DRAFT_126740 [Aspergillus foveolatus]|uniref:uncharacterized protein n=1 Tax=Aspergillus foveolatus TaxID=210207 RepID=UPI003CCD33CD
MAHWFPWTRDPCKNMVAIIGVVLGQTVREIYNRCRQSVIHALFFLFVFWGAYSQQRRASIPEPPSRPHAQAGDVAYLRTQAPFTHNTINLLLGSLLLLRVQDHPQNKALHCIRHRPAATPLHCPQDIHGLRVIADLLPARICQKKSRKRGRILFLTAHVPLLRCIPQLPKIPRFNTMQPPGLPNGARPALQYAR